MSHVNNSKSVRVSKRFVKYRNSLQAFVNRIVSVVGKCSLSRQLVLIVSHKYKSVTKTLLDTVS